MAIFLLIRNHFVTESKLAILGRERSIEMAISEIGKPVAFEHCGIERAQIMGQVGCHYCNNISQKY